MTIRRVFNNVFVFAIYLLTAGFGLKIGAVNGFATVVWPPSGISLAAILVLGPSVCPGIALAAFVNNFRAGGPIVADFGIAFGNTVEPLIAAIALRRLGFSNSFSAARNVLIFFAVVVVSTALGATIGTISLALNHVLAASRAAYTWVVWWFGDMMGGLIVTPVILAILNQRFQKFGLLRLFENVVVGFGLIFLSFLIFVGPWPLFREGPKLYFFFPFLAWASVRFGQLGTATAIFFVTAFAIWATIQHWGPFASNDLTLGLIHLQTFILALSLTSLLLAAYVAELRRAERIVHRKNDELESLVCARTHALTASNQALMKSKKMLDDAETIAKIGSWEWDPRSDMTTMSPALYDILEIDPKTFEGLLGGYIQTVSEKARATIHAAIRRQIETKQASEFEYEASSELGKKKVFHVRGKPYFDASGELIRVVGTTQDITEFKHIEDELRRARQAAEEANRAKTNFLANMSHEIRTPLGIILGFAELLVDPHETPEHREEFVKSIQKNGALLLELISDVLDLAKVEAGKIEIKKEEVNLFVFMEDIRELMEKKAHAAGLDMKFIFHGGLPKRIWVDARLLRQIFVNVVGNAIKFTPKGKVEIRTVMMTMKSGENRLVFDIADTGIGMTPEQCARIFQPFVQADETTTRKFGGTGLGLILSRRFAESLGGNLTIRCCCPDRGSVFRLAIDPGPLEKREFVTHFDSIRKLGADQEKKANISFELEGKEILVVDDSSDNQELMKHFLGAAGAKVAGAMNGAEGLEKALNGSFDMVLMDIQMPVLDGFRATAALREKGFKKPIVALTAHALAEERKRCLESGFDAYLSKPISRSILIEQLAHVETEIETTTH